MGSWSAGFSGTSLGERLVLGVVAVVVPSVSGLWEVVLLLRLSQQSASGFTAARRHGGMAFGAVWRPARRGG